MVSINTSYSLEQTYISQNNSQSEVESLQVERESLQKEVQSLQQELASGMENSSETIQAQITTLQSQISTIDSQIAALQSEDNQESSTPKAHSAETFIQSPLKELTNKETLQNTYTKLEETTQSLEQAINLDRGKGLNTQSKEEVLSNMKKNMENLTSQLDKLEVEVQTEQTASINIELVGNFINTMA